MQYAFDGYNYMLRLEKGEKVVESLTKFIKQQKILGGAVSAIGGLASAELGFYDLTAKAYAWTRFEEPLELLNLSGNIAWLDNKPFLHLHATVSDASQYARGGHLRDAEVNGTVEVFIHLWNDQEGLKRLSDKNTGLNLLQL